MADTTNYSFKKRKIGHPVRDDDVGDNLDLIDTAIKARETEIDALEALADGKILVGNGDGAATDVAMSGDVTIINTGETAIGANKVGIAELAATLQKGILAIGNIDITETTVWKFEFPFKVTINKVNTVTSIALSAHQTTVTLKNNAGTSMTNGVTTIASEAAKGDIDAASPTEHNVISTGEDLQFVSSGSCTTGEVIAVVHYTRTA